MASVVFLTSSLMHLSCSFYSRQTSPPCSWKTSAGLQLSAFSFAIFSSSVVLNHRRFCLPGDILQCLEIFLSQWGRGAMAEGRDAAGYLTVPRTASSHSAGFEKLCIYLQVHPSNFCMLSSASIYGFCLNVSLLVGPSLTILSKARIHPHLNTPCPPFPIYFST